MRSHRSRKLVVLLMLGALLALLSGCGGEDEIDVREGEPVEVAGLEYFVKMTRFMNPHDTEDAAYLDGAPKLESGQQYLGVFMTVNNTTDVAKSPSSSMTVTDTRGNDYSPADFTNAFTLPEERIPPGEELPEPGSPAANGPIKGSLVLFLVDEGATENRPLVLEMPVPFGDEHARVELDL